MGLEAYIKARNEERKKLMFEFKEPTITIWVSTRRQVFRYHTAELLILTDQDFIFIKEPGSDKFLTFLCHDLESELIELPALPDVCLKLSLPGRPLRLNDILPQLESFIKTLLSKSVKDDQL